MFRPSIFFLVLSFFSGCSTDITEKSSQTPPNIIWIVAEDISPGLGCYGDALAQTPNIDRLAQEGIRFNKAFATAPICAPSRSCLATGLYATSMGTQHLRCEIPFSAQLKTLPEYLSSAGYFTSNRNKTDYNFDPEGRWEHWSGSIAPWRHRKADQPFFSFINVGPSHEGSVNKTERYEQSIAPLTASQKTDRSLVSPPPYYPDTEASREVWARYYDVLRVMDSNVGQVLDSLEHDGLLEETIIFFFGDHGFGMPRYKRWLYNTGLQVPLLVRIPEKYKTLLNQTKGSTTEQLVSFVDFVPTVLQLAGLPIPETMEGQPFLGSNLPAARTEVYAARDRADDMFEMSRAVVNDQYIYIRHYMPHLPYIQPGYIYSDVKSAFKALREAKKEGLLNEEQQKLWQSKPVEELYDLQKDPKELNNLANSEEHAAIKKELKQQLNQWMLQYRDLGLLPEAEYMIRSEGSTPYDYARTGAQFNVKAILESAETVGLADLATILDYSKSEDSAVRYWSVIALMNHPEFTYSIEASLEALLKDPSPSVQIQAAEALCRRGKPKEAVKVLETWVQDDRPWVALQAARSILLIGNHAKPIIPTLYKVLEKNLGTPGKRLKYKDFNYAAFTSWALEWALKEMGEDIVVN